MAYGNLKADNLIYDDNGTDTVIPLSNVAGKANLANPAFTGSVTIDRATTGEDIAKFKSDGSCELYHNDVLRLSTTNVAVDVSGILTVSGDANFGSTSNTSITSSSDGAGGWHTMLENSSTGDLYLRGTEFYLQDNTTGNSNQSWIHCLPSAGVKLYYDGALALQTSDTGIQVQTNLYGLEGLVNFGTSGNCQVSAYSNNGSNSAEDNNTFKIYSQHGSSNATKTGILYQSFFDQVWRVKGGNSSGCSGIENAELGRINHDGGWELRYHDVQGSAPDWTGTTCDKKLETKADGVDVTGDLDVSADITAVDLTLSGDLTVNGTMTTIDTANLRVEDSLIYLARNNSVNTLDIGIYGKYIDNTAPEYTGLFRDQTDSKWKLFDSLEDIPVDTVNTSHATYAAATLVVGTLEDSKGDVRKIIQNTQGSTYTLVADDAGKHILASGTVTVPDGVFAAGDAVTIVNNTASDLTITKTITTMYMSTDATSTNRTLATRGMATILFASGTVAYISGAGLS